MNEIQKFILLNTYKNIKRQKRQYILIGILLLLITILYFTSIILMIPAESIVVTYKPLYTKFNLYMPDEEAQYVDADLPINEVRYSESIYYLCNQVSFGTILIGSALLLFIINSLINLRIYDIGILYSIGLNKKLIFWSLLLEIGSFIITIILAGGILSIICIMILTTINIIPKYFNQFYELNIIIIISIVLVILVLLILPAILLLFKIKRSSPLKLLRERV